MMTHWSKRPKYKPERPTPTNPDTGAVFVYRCLPGKNKFLKNFAADEIATLLRTPNDGFTFDHITSGSESDLVIPGGYPVRVDMDEDFMVIAARHKDKDKVLVYARENHTLIAEPPLR